MTSNIGKPYLSKAERMGLRAPVGSDKAMCVIAAMILVVLAVSSCSGSSRGSAGSTCPPAPDGSGHLSEYFGGYIGYSHPYSDNVTPIRVNLADTHSGGLDALDDTVPKGVEDEDEFVMELRDMLGQSLKSINFYVQPSISVYDVDPNKPIPPPIKSADFHILVRNPIDYTSIAVLFEGNELETIEKHSENTPCLSVFWSTEEQVFDESGNITVSFEATDIDGDELSYSIYYSTNAGNSYWWKQTAVMQNSLSSAMISAASLEISDQARLAVSVTDGERSMVWESPIFTVAEQPSKPTPKAYDDSANGYVSEPLRIYVLDNDLYTSNASVRRSLKIIVPPSLGATTVYSKTNGWVQTLRPFIEYTAESAGTDTLTYSICDSNDQCDSAQVTINITTDSCTILGTEQDDTQRGTSASDVICGLGGNDTIYASGGNDIIRAGLGDDTIYGQAGDDLIYGGFGNDDMLGHRGNDTAYGGFGDEEIWGGGDDDTIWGGYGADEIRGEADNDTLYGEDGPDLIHGGRGDDIIYGGTGNDTIRGNQGADTIYPGPGNNTLLGAAPEDTIIRNFYGR